MWPGVGRMAQLGRGGALGEGVGRERAFSLILCDWTGSFIEQDDNVLS